MKYPSSQSAQAPCSFDELAAIIALQQIEGLGPRRLAQLINRVGSVLNLNLSSLDHKVLQGLPPPCSIELRRYLKPPKHSHQWQIAERTLEWLDRTGGKALTAADCDFPKLLRQLPDYPALLYVKGQYEALNKRAISIVGTRNPTMGGDRFARELAGELSRQGLVVASGMARGIDAAAHQGVIDAGGQTVAVWATGLDRPYPPSNLRLAKDILSNGAVITEMPLGTPSAPGLFPRRNRLVSGLSLGVIVVEAALPSGSLITAAFAAEQNREVFAVPGSVFSEVSRGCHQLIKDGARLVESIDDVLQELNLESSGESVDSGLQAFNAQVLVDALGPELRQVYDLIQYEPTAFELIAATLANDNDSIRNSPDALTAALIELELEGLITLVGGLYQRRINRPGS